MKNGSSDCQCISRRVVLLKKSTMAKCIDGDDRTGLGNLTGRLTRRRRLPDRLGAGRRPRTAVGVSLLEFQQLRHARLKFTNRRLAVVTADDRSWFEPMPDHTRSPRLPR